MCLGVLNCTMGKASNRAFPILLPLAHEAVQLNPLWAAFIGQLGELIQLPFS